LSGVRNKRDLPVEALEYINFICKELGVPIDMISIGPSRKETIWMNSLF